MDDKKEEKQDERTLEEMDVRVKSMADTLETKLPEVVKEEVDQVRKDMAGDVTAWKEEVAEKQQALEERFTAALEKLSKPQQGDDKEERDEFYGYGEDGMGECINEILAASKPGGQPSERLMKLQNGEIERRRLDTLSGADGGWFMPPVWSSEILRIPDTSQFLKSMCRVLPAGTPPNAEIKIKAIDQTGSLGIYGGVTVFSATEAADVTVTPTHKLKVVSLKPEKIGAYYQLTEELRANAETMNGLIGSLLQGAVNSYEDDKIQTGTGAGQYLGFAGNDAEISVDRQTTTEINYIDLVNMLARILGSGRYVWLCQRVGCLPQLATLVDGAGQLIWANNARDGLPAPTLMGLPVFFNEISPALGSAGDLRLVDLSYYLIKPGMGVSIASDNTMGNFLSGIETIKLTYYSDGKPWLTDQLTLRDGTNTVSPFVSLAA